MQLSVLSHSGKEAVVAVFDPGHFFGEGCLAGQTQRMATATAMGACTVLTVGKPEMMQQLRARPDFAERFLSHRSRRQAAWTPWLAAGHAEFRPARSGTSGSQPALRPRESRLHPAAAVCCRPPAPAGSSVRSDAHLRQRRVEPLDE